MHKERKPIIPSADARLRMYAYNELVGEGVGDGAHFAAVGTGLFLLSASAFKKKICR